MQKPRESLQWQKFYNIICIDYEVNQKGYEKGTQMKTWQTDNERQAMNRVQTKRCRSILKGSEVYSSLLVAQGSTISEDSQYF